MGFLFNTAGTLSLLATLNGRYSSAGGMTTNRSNDLPLYQDQSNKLQDIWNTFGVSLYSSSSPSADTNWSTWLTAIEKHRHGGDTSGRVLKNAIASFLGDSKCTAIEFFAVPGNQISVYFPPNVPDPANPTKNYSAIITVETLTYDKVAQFVRVNEAFRRKGSAKERRKSKGKSKSKRTR